MKIQINKTAKGNSDGPSTLESHVVAPAVLFASLGLPIVFAHRYMNARSRAAELEKLVKRYRDIPTYASLPDVVFDNELTEEELESITSKSASENRNSITGGILPWLTKFIFGELDEAGERVGGVHPSALEATLYLASAGAGLAGAGAIGKRMADRVVKPPIAKLEEDAQTRYERTLAAHQALQSRLKEKTSLEKDSKEKQAFLGMPAGLLASKLLSAKFLIPAALAVGGGYLIRQNVGDRGKDMLASLAVPAALTGAIIAKNRARDSDPNLERYELAKKKLIKQRLGKPNLHVDIHGEPIQLSTEDREALANDLDELLGRA